MSEKQFKLSSETVLQYQIMDNDTDLNENEVVDLLNKLYEENEQLRTQLLICQQSKNDDGRFKVWQVPPIRRGMRVSITTIDDEQKRDSKRLEMVRMSEKRFQKGMNLSCVDTETGKNYWYACNLCGLLNEQQDTIFKLQEIIIDLKDDKNQLHKVISKLRQEVAELKTRNSVLSSKLNQIPESIKEVWLE